ncbi:MAG: hypothetical protein HYX63_17615 [Gammaproteobacteria bacterium]|nr:hypothetical protein [Gammaproteobacteria bacterium]
MKTIKMAVAIAGVLAAQMSFAHEDDRDRGGRAFDVCVNAAVDARFDFGGVDIGGNPVPPIGPGDRVTAAGMMLPAGTVPSNGSGDLTCNAYQSKKIGTFFVNGTFVSAFGNPAGHLPQAATDDLAYVDWHFRVDGVGAFDTSGLVNTGATGSTYPQTIIGGTGRFKNVRGEMTTLVLGASGFQIRVMLPND